MDNRPIGIFDSGVGGLTVARAIIDQLPGESMIYVGDTAHSPYGPKPVALVRELALNVMDDLVEQGVKMLVIACNSASSAVLADARERYQSRGLPVVEVIRPAVRRAARTTKNNRVGVIATQATVQAGAYVDAFAAVPDIVVTQAAAPRFVEFVERGITAGKEVVAVARQYLEPMIHAQVDTLVLGCTHYPLLSGVISFVMGEDVTLVTSSEECARDVFRTLSLSDLLASPESEVTRTFCATGEPEPFEKLAKRFLGPEVTKVRHIGHTHNALSYVE